MICISQSRSQTAAHLVASRQTGTATSILKTILATAGKDIRVKADNVSWAVNILVTLWTIPEIVIIDREENWYYKCPQSKTYLDSMETSSSARSGNSIMSHSYPFFIFKRREFRETPDDVWSITKLRIIDTYLVVKHNVLNNKRDNKPSWFDLRSENTSDNEVNQAKPTRSLIILRSWRALFGSWGISRVEVFFVFFSG